MKYAAIIAFFLLQNIPLSVEGGGNQDNKEQFSVMVNLGYELNDVDFSKDSIDFPLVESKLIAKVNELARNKKFAVVFNMSKEVIGGQPGANVKPNLYLNISLLFSHDPAKSGVNVYYAEDNDYTFQSIKFANMVVSEIRSSRLNLKVNGMVESDMSRLQNAAGPALQVDINLTDRPEDKLIITNEDKLNALAKLIYECIERISRS